MTTTNHVTMPRILILLVFTGVTFRLALGAPAVPAGSGRIQNGGISTSTELDAGFQLLYELKPAEARGQFDAWQKAHPRDPLGSAAVAASYLFEECNRQGIFTFEFFLNDKRLLGSIALKPDQALRAGFFAAEQQARDLARLQLAVNPEDVNALFATMLDLGMRADYASMIEKHQLESLLMIREADEFAKKLLALAPDVSDAYFTLGAANYIIASLPEHKRFFFRLAGIRGAKDLGIQQMQVAALHGRYLKPFAKMLLALMALRDNKIEAAHTQLSELVAEFPRNPIFASEMAKLNVYSTAPNSRPWVVPSWRGPGY